MKTLNILFTILSFSFLLFACNMESSKPSLEEEIAAIEKGLIPKIYLNNEGQKSFDIIQRMAELKVPGVSLAIVKDGKIHWAKGYGIANTENGSKVDTATLFQAGSISKPIAALAVLKLMEEGKVDLDTDVNNYLKDWKIEDNKFTADQKVTLRHLMTHTAGMTVHGFPGYQQDDEFPDIITVLNGEGNTPKIYVDTFPGAIWRYSGGGYTIMEKVVEDVSGMPMETFMDVHILKPLGMTNSTYAQPLPESFHEKASAAYDGSGAMVAGMWHNYPEQAAAGLWTTPSDLAKYCIAIQDMLEGNAGIFKKETVDKMLTKHMGDWGLGPSLSLDGDSLIFRHGGKNAGFTNNMVCFAHMGYGFIIMANGDNARGMNDEILNAMYKYHGINLVNSVGIDTISFSSDYISAFIGNYGNESMDFTIKVTKEGDKLVQEVEKYGMRQTFLALDSTTFIEIESGERASFEMKDNTVYLERRGSTYKRL